MRVDINSMLFSDQILVIPNLVSKNDCDSLIAEYEKKKITSYNEITFSATEHIILASKGRTISIDLNNNLYNTVVEYYRQGLTEFVNFLDQKKSFNIEVYKKQLRYPHQVRIIKYNVGQSIHPHTDWDDFAHASITLNLNEDYEGGEFAFFNKKHIVKLKKGDAIIFPADCFWVHEILPIIKGSRYSVNSFIWSLPFDEGKELRKQVSDLKNNFKTVFDL